MTTAATGLRLCGIADEPPGGSPSVTSPTSGRTRAGSRPWRPCPGLRAAAGQGGGSLDHPEPVSMPGSTGAARPSSAAEKGGRPGAGRRRPAGPASRPRRQAARRAAARADGRASAALASSMAVSQPAATSPKVTGTACWSRVQAGQHGSRHARPGETGGGPGAAVARSAPITGAAARAGQQHRGGVQDVLAGGAGVHGGRGESWHPAGQRPDQGGHGVSRAAAAWRPSSAASKQLGAGGLGHRGAKHQPGPARPARPPWPARPRRPASPAASPGVPAATGAPRPNSPENSPVAFAHLDMIPRTGPGAAAGRRAGRPPGPGGGLGFVTPATFVTADTPPAPAIARWPGILSAV